MTGDTVLEVATFLRNKVIAHVNERHPDRQTTPIVLERES